MELASEPQIESIVDSISQEREINAVEYESAKDELNQHQHSTQSSTSVLPIEAKETEGVGEEEKKNLDAKAETLTFPVDSTNSTISKAKSTLPSSLIGSNLNSPARPPSFEARSLLLPTSTSIKSLSSAAGSSTAISGTGIEADGNSTEADIRSTNSSLRSSPRSPSLRHLLGPSSAVLASAHLRRSPTLPPAPPSFSMFQGRARLVTDASPFDPVGSVPSLASASTNTINGYTSGHTPVVSRGAAEVVSSAPGPFPPAVPLAARSSGATATAAAVSSAHVVVTK